MDRRRVDGGEAVARIRAIKPASARFIELRLDYLTDPEQASKAVCAARKAGARRARS